MANNFLAFAFTINKLTKAEQEWLRKKYDEKEDAPPSESWGFHLSFSSSDVDIYAEESGDVEQAAHFVWEFLKEFRPKEMVGIQWAEWCDSPRPDNFGGGAVLVTAKKLRWLNTGSWLEHESQKLNRRSRG